jgi:hypothetical protein
MSLENPRAKPWRKRNSSSQIPKSEAVATCPTFRCRYRDQALLRPWMSVPVLVMQCFLAAGCTNFTIPNRPQVPRSSLRFSSRRYMIQSAYTIAEIPGTKRKPGYRSRYVRQTNCQRVPHGTPACLDRRPLEAGNSLVALRIQEAASFQGSSREHAANLTEGVDATIA